MTTSPQSPENKQIRFIPLMVRFVSPINIVLTIIAMVGVFVLSNSLSGNIETVEQNLLVQSAVQVAENSQLEYNTLIQNTQRITFTQGIAEAVQAQNAGALQTLIEPIGVATNLDSIIVIDNTGKEILGLLQNPQANDYSLSRETDLSTQDLVRSLLNAESTNNVGILQTPNGSALYVASVVRSEDTPVGIILAGQYLSHLLQNLQTNAMSNVTLYTAGGTLLETTFDIDNNTQQLLNTSQQTLTQILSNSNQVTLANGLSLNGQNYRSAYIPFSLGEKTLGVASIVMPDNVAFTTAGGRQVSAILMAVIAGAVTFVASIVVRNFTNRVEKVTTAVTALSQGEDVRVKMEATDEIGEMAVAINQYADTVKERENQFRLSLRRHRRERDYLLLVFESIPEGIVVQDMDGRVILMNEIARQLLGSQRVYRSAGIHELTEIVNQTLGHNIAPGLYALGNPQHIELDEKMLLAQASAIVVNDGHRLGSVVLLRDITEDVKRDRVREDIMSQIMDDIQVSMQDTSQRAMQNRDEIVRRLARDVAKHASTLQSMIVAMRELTQYTPQQSEHIQRPIALETLVWAVANDWRQIAQANEISLHIILEQRGLFILGDEHRLRYALGNLIDNAIKYNQNQGKLSIEVRGEANGMARIRIRDSGVGIRDEDMEHMFIRYYRGHPIRDNGEAIRVPGMGQGLTDTQQVITTHGGQIRIKTKVGVGTAIYIELPTTADTSYQLPLLEEDTMEGETMLIPDHVSVENFWADSPDL